MSAETSNALPVLVTTPQELIRQPLPGTLQQIESRILAGRYLAAVGAVDAARCIAFARGRWFADDWGGFLSWCRDKFGVQQRQACRCLRVGRFLVPHEAVLPKLAGTDLEKLELVSRIRDVDQQGGFLRHVDLSKYTRDEIARKVDLWTENGGKSDHTDGAPAAKAKGKGRKVPGRQELPVPPAPFAMDPKEAIAKLAELTSNDAAARAVLSDVCPMSAVKAAAGLLQAVFAYWLNFGGFPMPAPGQCAETAALMKSLAERFETVRQRAQWPPAKTT